MGLWVNYASPDIAGPAIPSILLQPTVHRSFRTRASRTLKEELCRRFFRSGAVQEMEVIGPPASAYGGRR
jgi:hypothetical protein